MHIENLVYMINQIAGFFASEPDRDVGIEGIRNHVRRFWDPRMRKAIIAHVAAGGEGVDQLAVDAVKRLDAVKAA